MKIACSLRRMKFNSHCVISFGWLLRGGNFRTARRRWYELPGRYPSNSTVRISWKLCTSPTLFCGRHRLPRIAASNSRWAAICWCFSQLNTRPRCSTLIEFLITFSLMKDDHTTYEATSDHLHSFAFYSNDQYLDCIVLPYLIEL
jgi:hypothetical protein